MPTPVRTIPQPPIRLLTPGNRPPRLPPAVARPRRWLHRTRAGLPLRQRKTPTPTTRKTRRKPRVRTLLRQNRKGAQRRPRCWRWRLAVKRGLAVRNRPQAAGPHLVRTHNLAAVLRRLLHQVGREGMPRRCGHRPVDRLINQVDRLLNRVRWEGMPRRCGHGAVAADQPVIRPVRVVLVFLVGTRREAIPEAPRARGLKGQPAWRTITGQPILVRPREPCAPS